MADRSKVTPEFLREILEYDPDLGILTWKFRPREMFPSDGSFKTWNKRFSGVHALCCKTVQGYLHGRILGVGFFAHRVAWAIHHGKWPDGEIDHRNGNRQDNSISNLQEASPTENRRNMRLRSDNTSGACGVYWDKDLQKWRAAIGVSGRSVYIGVYEEKNDAINARLSFQNNLGFSKRHGREL
jgi:hypothetical protein